MQRLDLMKLAQILAMGLFWPAVVLVIWGELTPNPPDIMPGVSDKLLHFMAYFGLSGLAITAIGLKRASLFVILALIAFGGALEILQAYTGRDPELLDEVANAIGTLLGVLTGCGFLIALKSLTLVAPTAPD